MLVRDPGPEGLSYALIVVGSSPTSLIGSSTFQSYLRLKVTVSTTTHWDLPILIFDRLIS
jgi:hypothetical protein